MRAIVLTYDRNRSLTDHMIRRYSAAWPDHPFTFRIPFQELADAPASGPCEMVASPPDIKGTVLRLLEGLPDDEFIYWCIDDKYPILLGLDAVRSVHEWVSSERSVGVDGVLFCQRNPKGDLGGLTEGPTIGHGLETRERPNYVRIWIHQYLRVKVIRHLFLSFPDTIRAAKEMDDLITRVPKPPDHRLLCTVESQAVFGESSSRGQLTAVCQQSMVEMGIALPEWATSVAYGRFVMGDGSEETSVTLGERGRRWIRNLRRRLLPT